MNVQKIRLTPTISNNRRSPSFKASPKEALAVLEVIKKQGKIDTSIFDNLIIAVKGLIELEKHYKTGLVYPLSKEVGFAEGAKGGINSKGIIELNKAMKDINCGGSPFSVINKIFQTRTKYVLTPEGNFQFLENVNLHTAQFDKKTLTMAQMLKRFLEMAKIKEPDRLTIEPKKGFLSGLFG